MSECVKHEMLGRCCCTCVHHVKDYYHCVTIDRVQFAIENNVKSPEGCVCSLQKGWICMFGPYSEWDEHGICEMHEHEKS